MLGIINSTQSINYMAIIAMQGHRDNIRKCPCIARSVLSCHAIAHYSSLPLGSARSNHDGTHHRLFWLPYLRHSSNSTHQTLETSPSTFNVNGDSPRIAIAAPVFSIFHLCHRHARSRNQAVRPLRLPAIHQILPPPQPPATHALCLYHRSALDRFWLIGACIFL